MSEKTASALARHKGKNYADKMALLEKESYEAPEAMELLTKVSTSKFDGTAELHIRINADTTQADQLVRTTVSLPHGSGKIVKIAAFVPDDLVADAKKAGADKAGNDDLIKEVDGGKLDFDVAVAHPDVMKDLAKVAKTLGQKGLMPNPKAGTVSPEIVKTIEELKKGRIECRMDKDGIIHVPFGKISYGATKLHENFVAIMACVG